MDSNVNNNTDALRLKYGTRAGIFGLISNMLLFGAKLTIGLISASITVIADAINNLSDMGNCLIVLFGFKLSSKPADSEHPFGHERYEQIMALIVAVIVTAIGVLLAKSSIEKLITPEKTTVSVVSYIVLSSAILLKLVQMLVYLRYAKKIDSDVLKASSIDSRNDAIATSAALTAMILIGVFGNTGFSIDGLFGLLVSLFIIISSFRLLREIIDPLLGQMPEKEFVDKLKAKILSYDGVLGIHDFMIHSYGAHKFFVTVHAEVSSKEDIMKSHDIIDNIERDFKEEFDIILSIHLDPIETDNPEVLKNKEKVTAVIKSFDKSFTIHDFRIVSGETHTNVLFDVVVPYSSKISVKEIIHALDEAYSTESKKYYFIIDIDRI